MSTNPALPRSSRIFGSVLEPETQPTCRAGSSLMACGSGLYAKKSLTARRPPGLSTRWMAEKTDALSASGTRLRTQLLMTQSTELGGRGRSLMRD